MEASGIQPGEAAPDFVSPITAGSAKPLKSFINWSYRIHFVDVVIRQAHPGPAAPPYHGFDQMVGNAWKYKHEDGIPNTVLVDDLEGTTHQVYGGLADPTYLIDSGGSCLLLQHVDACAHVA